MHPIVFSEYHQTKRGFPWVLLLFLAASVVMQFLFGPLAVLLLLAPGLLASVGVGTLAEEYSKGQLRFFYSMPISPTGLWCVKVLSGIIGTCLVVAVVLLPALFIRQPIYGLLGSDRLPLPISSLLAILVGQAVLAYAAGLFSMSFCQAPAAASTTSAFISAIPEVALVVAAFHWVVVPRAIDVALGLAAVSVPLWIGAYVLFRRRNPFFDQPWRWRGLAALFTGLHGLATAGVTYLLVSHPAQLSDPYRDGVCDFAVFGADAKVFALGRHGFRDVEAYVLDRDGRLIRKLFRDDRPLYSRHSEWSDATDSNLALCRYVEGRFTDSDQRLQEFVIDLETGLQTPVPTRDENDKFATYSYRRPSRDGRFLLGFKTVRQGDRYAHRAFRYDLTTSKSQELHVVEGEEIYNCHFIDDRRILLAALESDKPGEKKLTFIDVDSGIRTVRQMPADVRQTYVAPDGRTCAALRWRITDDTIRQELAVLDVFSDAWTTVFSADELPVLSFRDTLGRPRSSVSVNYPDHHSPAWMLCNIHRTDTASATVLINARTGARFELPGQNKASLGHSVRFSKDGSRLFALSTSTNEGEPDEDRRREVLLNVYQLKNNGIEAVHSIPWDALPNPSWLGNDRLLYLKLTDSAFLYDRGELWVVDVETGQQRPFFRASGPGS